MSWVFLTGPYAYKIKKPVDLGFADFSTLQKRHFFCQEELRVNRRFAPQLYLDVVPITGTPDAPVLYGSDEPIEFAVKMQQFPQDALLSNVLEQGKLLPAHIDGLAREVAEFHARIDVDTDENRFGNPQSVRRPMEAKFRELCDAIDDEALRSQVEEKLEVDTGWRMILIGALSNLVIKAGAVAVLGHRKLLFRVTIAFGIALLCGLLLLVLWP
jgi:aminoglycoside phosphotransferase family enzyme